MTYRPPVRSGGHLAIKYGGLVVLFALLAFSGASGWFASSSSSVASRRLLDDDSDNKCLDPGLQPDPCAYVMENCTDTSGIIPYLEMYYCGPTKDAKWATWIFFVLWLLVLFYLLGTSADSYFCQSLDLIADGLKMSPELAGLTILALGNGAPDVSSSILSTVTGNFDMGIGELFGAGLFVSTCVVGAVCFAVAKTEAVLDRFSFLRDMSFYIVGIVAVFFICWDGKIYIYESVSFLVYYFIYVMFAVVVHYCFTAKNAKDVESTQPSINVAEESTPLVQPDSMHDSGSASGSMRAIHHAHHAFDNLTNPEEEDDDEKAIPWTPQLFRSRWAEKSLLVKIFWFFTLPIRLPLTVSIPTIRWNRVVTSTTPIAAPVAALLFLGYIGNTVEMGSVQMPWAVLAALCGIPIGAVIFFTSSFDNKPIYYPVVVFFTFSLSIMWITGVANEVVGLLQAVGLIVDIPQIILGATVLAWGNSIGDMVANVVMARAGYPGMALAACFGGPLFNLLISMGVSFTYLTAKSFPTPFLVNTDHLYLLTGGFLFFALWTSLIIVALRRWRLHWIFGGYLFALYIAFMVLTVLVKLDIVWPNAD